MSLVNGPKLLKTDSRLPLQLSRDFDSDYYACFFLAQIFFLTCVKIINFGNIISFVSTYLDIIAPSFLCRHSASLQR